MIDQVSTEAFMRDIELGNEYEDFLTDKLSKHGILISNYKSRKYQMEHGENKLGIEIKFDNKLCQTGNIFIEVGHNPRLEFDDYKPSGIYKDDNAWLYLIGDKKECFIFSKRYLRMIHRGVEKGKVNGGIRIVSSTSGSSMGMLISRETALKHCEKHITF